MFDAFAPTLIDALSREVCTSMRVCRSFDHCSTILAFGLFAPVRDLLILAFVSSVAFLPILDWRICSRVSSVLLRPLVFSLIFAHVSIVLFFPVFPSLIFFLVSGLTILFLLPPCSILYPFGASVFLSLISIISRASSASLQLSPCGISHIAENSKFSNPCFTKASFKQP